MVHNVLLYNGNVQCSQSVDSNDKTRHELCMCEWKPKIVENVGANCTSIKLNEILKESDKTVRADLYNVCFLFLINNIGLYKYLFRQGIEPADSAPMHQPRRHTNVKLMPPWVIILMVTPDIHFENLQINYINNQPYLVLIYIIDTTYSTSAYQHCYRDYK